MLFSVAKQNFLVAEMKFLLVAGVSAVITFVFICVSLFTREWVTASFSEVGISLQQSTGIYPWFCISQNTCDLFWSNAGGWAIACFLAMLFVWIWEIGAIVELVLALFLTKRRYKFTRGFAGGQTVITLMLLFELIAYGATYRSNTAWLQLLGDVKLGYSYWLCLVATIFSIATMVLSVKALSRLKSDIK